MDSKKGKNVKKHYKGLPESGTVRKTMLRNIEQPIRRQPIVYDETQYDCRYYKNPDPERKSRERIEIKENVSSKYSKPTLQTTLPIRQRAEEKMKQSLPVLKSLNDLTPRSKLIARKRITKKLNVPIETAIYKDLIPLNSDVKDDRKRYPNVKRTKLEKDPFPRLSDYLPAEKPLPSTAIDFLNSNIPYAGESVDLEQILRQFDRKFNLID